MALANEPEFSEFSGIEESHRVAGDRIVVFLRVRVLLRDKTEWIDGRIADVFSLRCGLITHWRTFWESGEALAWVGAGGKPS